MNISDSINSIKGIGPKKIEEFKKLEIERIEDLIYHFPRGYEDRTKIKLLSQCNDKEQVGIIARVIGKAKEQRIYGRKLLITKFEIKNEDTVGEVIWYNMPFIKRVLNSGELYYFFGGIKKQKGKIQIQSPDFKPMNQFTLKEQSILPIYPLTSKLKQKEMRKYIRDSLRIINGELEEYLPNSIREKYKLCEINFAIENIHFPKNYKSYQIAKERLVFNELFLMQIGLHLLKKQYHNNHNGILLHPTPLINNFMTKLPFSLTKAQERVVKEIIEDVSSGKNMNRLLQGDVGSGKTIIAAISLLLTYVNGYQGIMMAPTEILANQHFETIKKLFKNSNIKVALLTGSLRGKEKKQIYEQIHKGEIHILIGTHAILEEKVKFHNVGLVITDEQHRFGVKQRTILSKKGNNPHVLVMTATPIPRTLAIVLYGDLDISIIDEKPPGRKDVATYHVNQNLEERVYNFIKKQIKNGRQAYIVCPLVEESESIEANSVLKLTEYLKKNFFKNEKVELLHGKIKNDEKDIIMNKFKRNEIDILISTTVIEVGINVPNATVMVIQNAERFGLAQLHQLRGRVGRGTEDSFCILITHKENGITKKRMETLTHSNDGFYIAEKDLSLRGPGEFLGIRQHGVPELKLANLLEDIQILKIAQNASKEIIENENYAPIEKKILKIFQNKINKISLN